MPEEIFTIKQNGRNRVKIKGSKFLGFAYRIMSEQDANGILLNLKKEYYDATHHCYAYKTSQGEEKYSDAGEPNGTAGIRILNAINHFNLTNIIIVIVRYFGGTKLGVGPLGKAYFDTSFELLKSLELIQLKRYVKVEITYNFEDANKLHHIINKYNAKTFIAEFDPFPKLIIHVPFENFEMLKNEIIDITANRTQITTLINNLFF